MTIAQAWEILGKYNKEPFHLEHARMVSECMRHFARTHDAAREEFWALVGLLHDIDFEMYPDEHCVRGEELLRAEGVDDAVISAALSHGFGMTASRFEPGLYMEKILYAIDELTGLIWAAAKMRPSKSCMDMEVASLKKKFKDKRFAAGVSRDCIVRGAEQLGLELDELMRQTIVAMREYEAARQ